MRHLVKKHRINRSKDHRVALIKNLAVSLILHERVKTTAPRARAIRPVIERLIANAKKATPQIALRNLNAFLPDPKASSKVMEELIKRYEKRSSGFVRMVALGYRPGDAASKVQIELV